MTTSALKPVLAIAKNRRKAQPLASIRKEKSFENLKFQAKTQQETEKMKNRRSELKDLGSSIRPNSCSCCYSVTLFLHL